MLQFRWCRQVALSFRAVELALQLETREVAESVGTVGADRGADRAVCACGPHQGPNRRAECGHPCATDEAGDRGGGAACASGHGRNRGNCAGDEVETKLRLIFTLRPCLSPS